MGANVWGGNTLNVKEDFTKGPYSLMKHFNFNGQHETH